MARSLESTLKNRKWSKQWWKTPKGKLWDYKAQAKKRGIAFELTDEEFLSFWQRPCTYCGDALVTIGLDRVDSDQGYKMSNVVPCCRTCNWMKKNVPKELFIEHCRKIVSFNEGR